MRCDLFSTTLLVMLVRSKANETTPRLAIIDSEVRPRQNDLAKVVETLFRKMMSSDESSWSDTKLEPDQIWEWDSWCHLQPQAGKCKKSVTRYYYDVQSFGCKTFVYSGCDGNLNSFETKEQCEEKCQGTSDHVGSLREDAACTYQPNSGMCLALMEKFYWDVNAKKCKRFIYGGCGGNLNRFNSWEQCDLVCNREG